MIVAGGRAIAKAGACDYAASPFSATAAIAVSTPGRQIEGSKGRDIDGFSWIAFRWNSIGITEASGLNLGWSASDGGRSRTACGKDVCRHHFGNNRCRVRGERVQLPRRNVDLRSRSLLHPRNSRVGSGKAQSILRRIDMRNEDGIELRSRLWLMIHRSRSADQLRGKVRMCRSRKDFRMQHAYPHQESHHAGLCPGAENEFRPGSSRLRKQREWSLRRSEISHDHVYSTNVESLVRDLSFLLKEDESFACKDARIDYPKLNYARQRPFLSKQHETITIYRSRTCRNPCGNVRQLYPHRENILHPSVAFYFPPAWLQQCTTFGLAMPLVALRVSTTNWASPTILR